MEQLQAVFKLGRLCSEQYRTVGTRVFSDLLKDDS